MVNYTIKDIDNALQKYIDSRKPKLYQNKVYVPVPLFVCTPDEFIAKRTYPCLFLETAFNTYVDPQFKVDDIAYLDKHPTDKSLAVKKVIRTTDFFYECKLSFYVIYPEHLQTMILWLTSLFPLDSCMSGVTETTKEDFCFPLTWDGRIINMDEQNTLMRLASGIAPNQQSGDVRTYRRDVVVTAHLTTENQTVETPKINFAGLKLLYSNE